MFRSSQQRDAPLALAYFDFEIDDAGQVGDYRLAALLPEYTDNAVPVVEGVHAITDATRQPWSGARTRQAFETTGKERSKLDSEAVALDPFAPFRLDGQVAIVTGASGGLGARFARVLDAAGARVVLAARRTEHLEQLATDLRDAHVVSCDLSLEGAPSSLVAATLAHYDRVDVLVNNAGTSQPTPAFDETTDKFAATLRINLVAPFELARECARAMIAAETGGTIVNVASIWGLVGVGQIPEAGYAASKGGLVNLTRELGAQWARKGVRVNCLAPGWFRSEMTEGLMFGDENAERWMRQRTPMGRGGEEDELDGALLFLASAASSFMTGQVVCVDGGWTSI